MDDLQALKAYVTAKDGYEYVDLPDGIVAMHITHSNLARKIVDIRLELHMSIGQVKEKIYRHCGTSPEAMELVLKSTNGQNLAVLNDNSKKLGFYSVQSGMTLHVIDTDPFSLSKGGGLDNVSLVEKYEISEEKYENRKNTVRAYKREQLAKDPNWKPPTLRHDNVRTNVPATPAPGPDSVASMRVGDRCEVQPGGRRGTVQYLGEVPEIAEGYWVGVVFDEPVGKGNGCVKGKVYFKAEPKFGGFIRPPNVTVGDFPVEDPFDMSSDEDEL